MFRRVAACLALVAVGAGNAAPVVMTAEQVAERNVNARGGLEAWRKVDTMVWAGHMVSMRAEIPGMLFVMEQQRPNKRHFQLRTAGMKMMRIFDGKHGWIERPSQQGGPPDVKAYTPAELAFEQRSPGLDGPLIDYQAKGNTLALEGLEEVEGRRAFRLKVVLSNGEVDHVWVDPQTFLELRYDRPSYGPPGAKQTVSVFYRDYKEFDGLQVPTIIETAAGPGQSPDRMVIERVTVNARLDQSAFADPRRPRRDLAGGSGLREPADPALAGQPPARPDAAGRPAGSISTAKSPAPATEPAPSATPASPEPGSQAR
jgi:hypothetical protein